MRFFLVAALTAMLSGCVTPTATNLSTPKYVIDADAKWGKLNTIAYRGKQDDIHFIDANTGWYGNGAGKIYRTLDGGKHWLEQLDRPGTFVRALGFVDQQRGFMGNVGTDYYPGVTDTNPLHETRDGGVTWSVIPSARIDGPIVKGICAIDVLKKQSVFQGQLQDRVIVHAAGRVGGPAFLMRSLDGGERWRVLDLNLLAAAILDVKFFDENIGFVFTATNADTTKSNAAILMTRDGGVTWKTVYKSNRPYELMWKASFPTRDVGYATIQSYDPDKSVSKRFVAKTIDGGLTWTETLLVDDHAVREFGVGFIDENTGWIGASTSGFQTTDGGQTWAPVEMGRAVNKIRLLPTTDGFTGYAIGVDVYKLSSKRVRNAPH